MTRDEIYDHLAQVYLGKRTRSEHKNRKKQFNTWLFINLVITCTIFVSAFYGLTAFLAQKGETLQNRIIFSLSNGPVRIKYNLNDPFPPVKSFSLTVPAVDLTKYESLQFSIRGLEEGHPGIVKIVIRNRKNETSSYFIQNVNLDWQEFTIPIEEFTEISDWGVLTDVSFVFESWNVEKKKGIVLIEDVCFST